MIDIEMFQIKLIQRIQRKYGVGVGEIIDKIKEDLMTCMEPDGHLKCEWITCKFNSEKGNKGEGQLGDCQYIGTIALKTPVFEVDPENECASLVDETMACTIYEPDEKLHPSVKTSFHFVYPD